MFLHRFERDGDRGTDGERCGDQRRLVPRLTLSTATGQVLDTSDGGTMGQNLAPGTYVLAVSGQTGAGAYRLTTTFVPGSSLGAPLGVGAADAVAVADLTGDGRPDIITANGSAGNNTVSVLLGNGDGSFQTQQTFAGRRRPRLRGGGGPQRRRPARHRRPNRRLSLTVTPAR